MRIKYAPDVQPLLNEHYGFTFQPNHYGQSMLTASRSARFRHPRQNNVQHNNQKAVTQWRNMSPATKADWGLFAATYQQPSKRNPALFLSGYQLFLKRNSYCFLNHGITSDFMLSPEMAEKIYEETVFFLEAGTNTVDVTELYISNFGILPIVGQTLLFCAIPYSDKSGQFFTPIFDTLIVEEIYLDGFFLNLVLPENSTDICYSVFLSKPVNPGQSYVGTKIRYMGCFTSKTFLALTDTPNSYTGQSGKEVLVKANESGLEFSAAIKVAIDFIDASDLVFIYNCPVPLKFTSQESEFSDASILPALDTVFAQYDKVTITAAEVGLIVLNGVTL